MNDAITLNTPSPSHLSLQERKDDAGPKNNFITWVKEISFGTGNWKTPGSTQTRVNNRDRDIEADIPLGGIPEPSPEGRRLRYLTCSGGHDVHVLPSHYVESKAKEQCRKTAKVLCISSLLIAIVCWFESRKQPSHGNTAINTRVDPTASSFNPFMQTYGNTAMNTQVYSTASPFNPFMPHKESTGTPENSFGNYLPPHGSIDEKSPTTQKTVLKTIRPDIPLYYESDEGNVKKREAVTPKRIGTCRSEQIIKKCKQTRRHAATKRIRFKKLILGQGENQCRCPEEKITTEIPRYPYMAAGGAIKFYPRN